jgi:hypothetical protein
MRRAIQVPQSHRHERARGVPVEHADDGIDAHAAQRHAGVEEDLDFCSKVQHPFRAMLAPMRGLGNDEFAAVPVRHLLHKRAQGHAAGIVIVQPGSLCAMHPLAVPVVVDADHVQMGSASSHVRPVEAAQHVPSLEYLVLVEVARSLNCCRLVVGGSHAAQRVGVQEPRMAHFRPNRVNTENRRAYQLHLQVILTS